MRAPNFYVAEELDRVSDLRRDEHWLAERTAAPESRLLPVWRNQSLIAELDAPVPVFVPLIQETLQLCEEIILLGMRGGVAYFTADVSRHDAAPFSNFGTFRDLREVGPLLQREDGALLAYARGMTTWQQRHLYCGRCGSATESREAGHVRVCGNTDCGTPCFPRTDPAVIMLIHDGGDRCILGRQKVWRAGQHSVLAGFVEPGESLEDAVSREVLEEVGVRITDVDYHSSQPWPFPSSIMLGFTGRAVDPKLNVNTAELEAARWFSREEILNCPQTDEFRLPRADSISRRLIEDWAARR